MNLGEVESFMGVDCETTGVDTDKDRIVTFSLIEAKKGQDEWNYSRQTVLLNPGVDIPAGAIAVHGITNEMAAEGEDPKDSIKMLKDQLEDWWSQKLPVVGQNLAYDLSLIDSECRRYGLGPLEVNGPCLDTMVLHRMTGNKKASLDVLCSYYGVTNEAAHSSESDTITTLQVLLKMIEMSPRLRETSLRDLWTEQKVSHKSWARGMNAFFKKIGKTDVISDDWPIKIRSEA